MPRKPPNRKEYPTEKPYPTFPLSPRKDGRFAIKIHGTVHIFGRRGEWQQALQEYRDAAGALHGKRIAPAVEPKSNLTVKLMGNKYIDDRRADVPALLSLGSWDDYRSAIRKFTKFVGGDTPASEIGPEHFSQFAAKLKDSLGPYAYNRNRSLVMTWIRYAVAAQWVKPVNFGNGFKRIPAAKIRETKESKLFAVKEIRKLIKLARPQIRAMILLAINGGFGATDCAALPKSAVDLKACLINFPRTKTNIPRAFINLE